MNADEIDEMMIRLIGDATEFSVMIQDAIKSTKRLEQDLSGGFGGVEKEMLEHMTKMSEGIDTLVDAQDKAADAVKEGLTEGMSNLTAELTETITKSILYAAGAKKIIAAIWDWTKASFANLDALGKQADQLRMTTSMVKGLQMASNKLGVDFNAVTGAIETMQRNTANMHITGGMLNNEFARLGLNFQEVSRKSPENQLFDVVEALQGVEDFTTKSRIATKLLGDNWQEVYRLGKEGIEAAKQAMQDAEDFNLAPSRAEIKMIEDSNRAWNKMFLTFEGIGNTVSIALAPAFEYIGKLGSEAGKRIVKLFQDARPMLDEFVQTGIVLGDTILDWITYLGGTEDAWKSVSDGMLKGFEFITDSLIVIQWAFENLGDLGILSLSKIELGILSTFGEFKHFFVETAPAYLNYFFDNWKEIISTLGKMTQTVFGNLANNIESVWTKSQNWISEQILRTAAYWEGTSDEVLQQQLDALHEMQETPKELKGLLDGFKNTLPEIPDIPERTLSEYEKSLIEQIKTMESGLGNSLEEYFIQRKAEAEARRKALEAEAEAETSNLEYAKDFTQPQVDFGLSSAQQTAIQLQGNPALNPQKETAMNTKRLVAMSVEQKKDREEFMREFREKGRRVDNIFVLDD